MLQKAKKATLEALCHQHCFNSFTYLSKKLTHIMSLRLVKYHAMMKNDLYYVECERLQQVAALNAQVCRKLSIFSLYRFCRPSSVIGIQEIHCLFT